MDGDGDRIVFGNGRGILNAGFASLPVLKALVKFSEQDKNKNNPESQPGNRVIYDPKVSPIALLEWGKIGIKPFLFRNGHSQVKAYMDKIGALSAVKEPVNSSMLIHLPRP